MDILATILFHPFTWGLAVGLIFAAWAFFGGWRTRRELRREVRRLEEHSRTAADLHAKGTQALLDENAELKRQAENLRISLAELKNKPDRAELQKLYVLDKAVHLMYERAPGFAPAWEAVLKEARGEFDKTSNGLLPWLRRVVHLGGGGGTAPAALPSPEAPDGEG